MWLSPVERRHVEDRHVDGTRGAPTTRVRRARAVRGTPPCVWTARPPDGGGGVGEECDCASSMGRSSRGRRGEPRAETAHAIHRHRESRERGRALTTHAIRAHAGGALRLRSRDEARAAPDWCAVSRPFYAFFQSRTYKLPSRSIVRRISGIARCTRGELTRPFPGARAPHPAPRCGALTGPRCNRALTHGIADPSVISPVSVTSVSVSVRNEPGCGNPVCYR